MAAISKMDATGTEPKSMSEVMTAVKGSVIMEWWNGEVLTNSLIYSPLYMNVLYNRIYDKQSWLNGIDRKTNQT